MLQRWDPFTELRRMENTMNRLWRGFDGHSLPLESGEVEAWTLPLDVVDEGDNMVVRASLPGIHADDIDVSIENHVLTIKAQTKAEEERAEANYLIRERRAGSFYRAIRLPESADTSKADSAYEHGVLTVTLPKVETRKARRVEVKVGGAAKPIEGKKA